MLGIVMPVYLCQQPLLDLTIDAVTRLQVTQLPGKLYVVTTRLHLCTSSELQAMLAARCQLPVEVLHEDGVSLSVAGAWNRGCTRAIYDGADFLAICANDALVEPRTLDTMLNYGRTTTADMWSAIDIRERPVVDRDAVTDGPDFSCVMFRPDMIKRFGYFDENFKPAYFEDNDYYVRIVQGGGMAVTLHAAPFYHHGSQTSKLDPDAAHHVRHWFGMNRLRFHQKWGVSNPPPTAALVREQCYKTPWNEDLPISYCDR